MATRRIEAQGHPIELYGLTEHSPGRTVPAVAGVWTVALALMAAMTGWSQGTYLRRTNPTRRVPVLRWHIPPRGGPSWVWWVGAAASMASLFVLLRISSDTLALAVALVVGWTAIAMFVQAVVLRRHNEQVRQRP